MLIKDEKLREAVARSLHIKEEEITKEAMSQLTSLSARYADYRIILKGLETCCKFKLFRIYVEII